MNPTDTADPQPARAYPALPVLNLQAARGQRRPAFQRMMQKQGIAWPQKWPEPKT